MKNSRPLFVRRPLLAERSGVIGRFGLTGLFFVAFLILLSGCSLKKVKLPQVMNENPSGEEIAEAVNQNSKKINALYSDNASISTSQSAWTAKCHFAYQRENNIRLTGNLNMVGQVLDMGCNDQDFWFWFKNQEPEQLSYCPVSEYAESPLRNQIPVDPEWFHEAFGIVEIQPSEIVEGPAVMKDNSIKIVTRRTRPNGTYLKTMFLEPKTAAILRQEIKNEGTGESVVVSCSEFQYLETAKVSLPKRIIIDSSTSSEKIHLDLGTPRVNPTDMDLAQYFRMPKAEDLGTHLVNIGKNGQAPISSSAAPSSTVPANTPPTLNQVSETKAAPNPTESGVLTDDIPAYAAQDASAPSASSEAEWGTGNSVYSASNQSSGDGNALAPPLASGFDIPQGTSETPSENVPSENGAISAQFQTVVVPNETRFQEGSQGFYNPSL